MERQESLSTQFENARSNRLILSNEDDDYIDTDGSITESDIEIASEHDTNSEQDSEDDEAAAVTQPSGASSPPLQYIGKDGTVWRYHSTEQPSVITTIRQGYLTDIGKQATGIEES